MPAVTIVYWRDIPAQVIVGKGRRGSKRPLPERFEQAIDRAAMKIGAGDSDAYLAEWRKADPFEVEAVVERVPEDAVGAEFEWVPHLRPAWREPAKEASGFPSESETPPVRS